MLRNVSNWFIWSLDVLANESNSAYWCLATHTTLNTYKPMEISIERSPQH